MRIIAIAGSSLLLAAVLPALAQEGPSDEEIRKQLKALAAADDSTREQVLRFFDDMPLRNEPSLLAAAWVEGTATFEAAWRRLPHIAWSMILFDLKASIGSARRTEKELLGPDPKPRSPKVPGTCVRSRPVRRVRETSRRSRLPTTLIS
jgi:hypothetical protein